MGAATTGLAMTHFFSNGLWECESRCRDAVRSFAGVSVSSEESRLENLQPGTPRQVGNFRFSTPLRPRPTD